MQHSLIDAWGQDHGRATVTDAFLQKIVSEGIEIDEFFEFLDDFEEVFLKFLYKNVKLRSIEILNSYKDDLSQGLERSMMMDAVAEDVIASMFCNPASKDEVLKEVIND